MGTKHEVVSARTLRRAISELEKRLMTILATNGEGTDLLKIEVDGLRRELEAALARKPNAALQQLVYQLRTTRAELALVQETLEKNTAVIERFVSIFNIETASGAELDRLSTLSPLSEDLLRKFGRSEG